MVVIITLKAVPTIKLKVMEFVMIAYTIQWETNVTSVNHHTTETQMCFLAMQMLALVSVSTDEKSKSFFVRL